MRVINPGGPENFIIVFDRSDLQVFRAICSETRELHINLTNQEIIKIERLDPRYTAIAIGYR